MKTRLDFVVPLSLLAAAAVGFAIVQELREEQPESAAVNPAMRRLRVPGVANPPRQISDAVLERSRHLAAEREANQLVRNQQLTDMLAKSDPDQLAQRSVAGFMKRREPNYRKLLSDWNLDSARADQVLEVLSSWEFHAFKDSVGALQKLPTDAKTLKQEQKQWTQKYASKRGGLELSIEAELLPLLGTERIQQIMQLREQMRKDEQSKLIGTLDREKND